MGTGSHGEDRGCGPDLALQRVFETGVHDRLEISDLLSQALAIHSVSGGTGCGVRHRCSAAASGTAVHGTRRGTSRAVRCERDLSEACTETNRTEGGSASGSCSQPSRMGKRTPSYLQTS